MDRKGYEEAQRILDAESRLILEKANAYDRLMSELADMVWRYTQRAK